jgi:hypothetical protein
LRRRGHSAQIRSGVGVPPLGYAHRSDGLHQEEDRVKNSRYEMICGGATHNLHAVGGADPGQEAGGRSSAVSHTQTLPGRGAAVPLLVPPLPRGNIFYKGKKNVAHQQQAPAESHGGVRAAVQGGGGVGCHGGGGGQSFDGVAGEDGGHCSGVGRGHCGARCTPGASPPTVVTQTRPSPSRRRPAAGAISNAPGAAPGCHTARLHRVLCPFSVKHTLARPRRPSPGQESLETCT